MNNYYDCDRDEIIFDNCVFFSLYKTESEYLMLMRHRISNENPNVNPSVFNTTYIMRYDTNMNKQNNTQEQNNRNKTNSYKCIYFFNKSKHNTAIINNAQNGTTFFSINYI